MAGSHGRRAVAASGKRRSNISSSAFVRNTSSLEVLTGTSVSRRQLRVAAQQAAEAERAQFKIAKRSVTKRRAVKTAATITATGGLLLTFAMPSYAVSPVTAASTDLTSPKLAAVAQAADATAAADTSDTDNANAADDSDTTTTLQTANSDEPAGGSTVGRATISGATASDSQVQDVSVKTASLKNSEITVDRADASATASDTDSTDSASDDSGSDAGSQNFAKTALLSYAAKYFGVKYVWGGTTPSGFDCSGYTAWVFSKFGIHLPHSSSAQGSMGTRVSASNAKPGDLLWIPGHVGIYAGNGRIMHAPHPGSSVKIQKMWGANWKYIRL